MDNIWFSLAKKIMGFVEYGNLIHISSGWQGLDIGNQKVFHHLQSAFPKIQKNHLTFA
jgi:hypothetical protein